MARSLLDAIYGSLIGAAIGDAPGRAWDKERFFSGNSIELVPITLALLHLTGGEVNQALIEAAHADLFAEIEGDPAANFRAMAVRLETALRAERAAALARARVLREMIGEG